ncbi:MAG: hypothetical protein QXU75_04815 [Candidatus Methanomethylicaceae archaeon]
MKGLLTSKTFWGLVILLAARFVPALADVSGEEIAHAFDLILTGVGALLAIYGRVVATKKIKGLV